MTDQPAAEPTLRLSAYYYTFEATGCLAVDKILSAVACAGKGFHHTADWQNTLADGTTFIEHIQEAADNAAAARDRLAPVNERLVAALEDMITRFERCMVVGGTDAEFARCATAEARAVLDEAHK